MVSEEEVLGYDDIIVFRMSMYLEEDIQKFLGEYYQEEERYFGDRVIMYRRKENF